MFFEYLILEEQNSSKLIEKVLEDINLGLILSPTVIVEQGLPKIDDYSFLPKTSDLLL